MTVEYPWSIEAPDETPILQLASMPGEKPVRRETTRNQKLRQWFPTVESLGRITVEEFCFVTHWSKDRAYTLQEETLKNHGVQFLPQSQHSFFKAGIIRPSLRFSLYRMNVFSIQQLEQHSLNELMDMMDENPRARISATGIATVERALHSCSRTLKPEPLDPYHLCQLKNRKDGTAMGRNVNAHDPETGRALLDDDAKTEYRKTVLLERRDQLLRQLNSVDEALGRLNASPKVRFVGVD